VSNPGIHSELDTIEKIRLGDVETFSQLFRRYYEPLCMFAARFTRDFDAAENIVQEVFVKLWDGRESLSVEVSLKGYMYASVRNSCLNYIKRESLSSTLERVEGRSNETTTRPDIQLESSEISQTVERAINKLPHKRREIFCMAKYDDLSYQEIAEIQNVSVNTVKTQLKRALKTLAKSLQYMHIVLLLLTI